MSRRTDRRQFLQAIAASAGAATGACQTEDAPTTEGSGATAGAGTGGSAVTAGSSGTAGSAVTGGTAATAGSSGTAGSAVTGGGGTSGGQAGSGNQPPLTSPLGVALLGLGNYASTRLAPALQLTQHCKLRGIVTGTPSKVPMWQEKYGIESANVYSYDTMAATHRQPEHPRRLHRDPPITCTCIAIAAARARARLVREADGDGRPRMPGDHRRLPRKRRRALHRIPRAARAQHANRHRLPSSKPYGAILNIVADAELSGFR